MTAADRLDEIQARADAATDGPWGVDGYDASHVVAGDTDDDGLALMDARVSNDADAEFIAHARTDVPALVAALRAVLDLHVGVVDCCDECSPMKCAVCEAWEWPCDTVRAVEAALGEVAS